MYIVLTAFLALNVSSDVLNGFHKVHDGLKKTNSNMASKNEAQFIYLSDLYAANPEKVGSWFAKGNEVRARASRLVNTIDSLKGLIAVAADGKDANLDRLTNAENLEASGVTMLNPVTSNGTKLRQEINDFKELVTSYISDPQKKAVVSDILSTDMVREENTGGTTVSWEESLFDNVPAIAAMTHLAKLQNDVREAESEALSTIITNVDIGDVRVNQLNPYVIPSSNLVMKGGVYSAQVVLAAVDTTQRPSLFIDGARIDNENGYVQFPATSSGVHDFSGYMEITRNDGSVERRPFSSSYTVMEPMATVSPTMMNVLYAGIDNPVSISVPGVPMSAVQATMTNGTLVRKGDTWMARPAKVDAEAMITVTANIDGKTQSMGTQTFRVRRLPDPSPYISINDAQGNGTIYKGSPQRISKSQLLSTDKLNAAIDDNLLNVSYSVVSFSTVFFDAMGNALPEISDGSSFSSRQKEQIRRLKPGKSFFISNVKAVGPDGITRTIAPMEVALK